MLALPQGVARRVASFNFKPPRRFPDRGVMNPDAPVFVPQHVRGFLATPHTQRGRPRSPPGLAELQMVGRARCMDIAHAIDRSTNPFVVAVIINRLNMVLVRGLNWSGGRINARSLAASE